MGALTESRRQGMVLFGKSHRNASYSGLCFNIHLTFLLSSRFRLVLSIPWKSDGSGPLASPRTKMGYDFILHVPDLTVCPGACVRPVGLAFDALGRLFVSSDSTGEVRTFFLPVLPTAMFEKKNINATGILHPKNILSNDSVMNRNEWRTIYYQVSGEVRLTMINV